jgi:uncharacterized protein (TIGR02266 family)
MPLIVKKSPLRAVQMHRRFSLRLPIPITENRSDLEGRLIGFAKNISAGGLFVQTREPLGMGSKVSITFSLPSGEMKVNCRAEVVWRRARDPYSAYEAGMGLKFLDLDYQTQTLIDSFVREQSALLA